MDWNEYYTTIITEIDSLLNDRIDGCVNPFFRGVSSKSFELLPTLFRDRKYPDLLSQKLEMSMFSDFESQSAIFHSNQPRNSWETLYEMRHHGIRTRLLDWSGSFAIALYFALRHYKTGNTPAVWILNPIKLNEKSVDRKRIIGIDPAQDFDYRKLFVNCTVPPFKNPVAILPMKSHPRLVAQNSFFTVHGTNTSPLNEIYSGDVVKRFDIPPEIIPEARKFLHLTNMNEYSLFPDLDGLGRKMNKYYFDEWETSR
jgi:hypothetical protein